MIYSGLEILYRDCENYWSESENYLIKKQLFFFSLEQIIIWALGGGGGGRRVWSP